MPDPQDLARWRELADGIGEWHTTLREVSHGLGPDLRAVESALRSACDEIEQLREAMDNAEARGRETVKREAVTILNAMREEGESDLRQARARIESIP